MKESKTRFCNFPEAIYLPHASAPSLLQFTWAYLTELRLISSA